MNRKERRSGLRLSGDVFQRMRSLESEEWFFTADHLQRVVQLACAIGNGLGFPEVVQMMVDLDEKRGLYTADHQHRVTQLAVAIAGEMSLLEEQIDGLRFAASIHDLGKFLIPESLLIVPFREDSFLDKEENKEEWDKLMVHPQIGYRMLKRVEFPWPVAQIVLQHHERMDGSGYPQGLSGEDILLEARILAVADVVESMSSDRPYRSTPGLEKALKRISRDRGILYDSQVVDTCLRLFREERFVFEDGGEE